MSLQERIVESMRQSAARVFSTMMGTELGSAELTLEKGAPAVNDGVLSFIGIAGAWVGSGSISCSPSLACRICSRMLMADFAAVDEEVLDAVAELTNMVIGGVKSDLEGELGPLGLSIPTVVFGKNFQAKSAGTTEWIVLRFPWDGDLLVIKMCLTRGDKAGHGHTLGACALEV